MSTDAGEPVGGTKGVVMEKEKSTSDSQNRLRSGISEGGGVVGSVDHSLSQRSVEEKKEF